MTRRGQDGAARQTDVPLSTPISLPSPEIYEAEYGSWPWGRLIESVAEWVVESAPRNATVVDYMCGTGFLLRGVARRRVDLVLIGCDVNRRYVQYARAHHCGAWYRHCDVLHFNPGRPVDIALCTAGLHHLAPKAKSRFLREVATHLGPAGTFVVGEEVLAPYRTDQSRRLSVLGLWLPLLQEIVRRKAQGPTVEAALSVLRADLLQAGEYKTSYATLVRLLNQDFAIRSTKWTWRTGGRLAGDVIVFCQNRRR